MCLKEHMYYLKWSQEPTGIIWMTQEANIAEKKEPLLNELFHQTGLHLTLGGEKWDQVLILAWDPITEKDWQISFSPEQSDVRDMNWQQFTSPALSAPLGHEHWWCCRASSISVGYTAGISTPRTHEGQFLFSLLPVKSCAVQTFKNTP